MKDLSTTNPLVDDIASLIDEALADPVHADTVRSAILARLATVPEPRHSVEPSDNDADLEDLWDNVPL